MTGHRIRLGAIILGAGASSRMGEPKLVLPWQGTSIIGHLLSVWTSVGAEQIAVVCAPSPHPLHGELDHLSFDESLRIINPVPDQGMFSSIQCAARWNRWNNALTHFVIILGDQPQIPMKTIQNLLDIASEQPARICQPACHGRPKHPIILPKSFFAELCTTASKTLRDFLEHHAFQRSFAEIDDDSLNMDLDSPADYKAALGRFSE
jgi:molybdenum cofactor cytidylyltransferase